MKTIVTVVLILISQVVTAYDIKINGLCYSIIYPNAYVVYGDKKANSHGLVYDFPNKRNFNGTIEIPAKISYNGVQCNVVGIQDGAFKGCVNLKHVIISEGVKSIGDEAFALCERMETIDIPNSVDYISSSAFYCCWALKSATLPDKLVTEDLFYDKVRERLRFEKVRITRKNGEINNERPIYQSNVAATSKVEPSQAQTYVQENPQQVIQKNTDVAKKKERRIALIIGNAKYASQRLDALNSPLKDARDVKEKLQILGFNVRPIVENGSKNTMRKAIKDFIKEAKNYDVALFYYSGHGIQSKPGINATNYLIPSDAKLQYSESLSGECIDLNEMVLNNLSKEREGKASLVFIDACRTVLNLPSESDFVDAKGGDKELRGLNEQASPEGVCVVYATRAGSVSYDMRPNTEINGQNSLNSYFTQGLLECLDEDKDKNLPIFIQRLKDKVRAKTNGRQVPSPYNELYGDFYFDPNK